MKHNPFNEFEFNKAYCSVAVGVIGASLVGAAATAYSANQASKTQKEAAGVASQTQLQAQREANALIREQYGQTREDLKPFREFGAGVSEELKSKLPFLTTPIDMSQEMLDLQKPIDITQEQLEKLPGYQFTREQGLKAVQNSAAARGLGVSGAALKGAATFATGLAGKTGLDFLTAEMANRNAAFGRHQTTYSNKVQSQANAFNRLKSLVDTGQTAAAQTGAYGSTAAAQQGGNITAAGNAVASNTIGAANAQAAATNAMGSAVAQGAGNIGGYVAYRGLYGNTPSTASGVLPTSAPQMYSTALQ